VLFRFAFAYIVLYALPFPAQPLATVLGQLPNLVLPEQPFPGATRLLLDGVILPCHAAWDDLVVWAGGRLPGVEITARPGRSGDTTWNHVQVLCILVLAAAAAVVWSVLDRRRAEYRRVHEWLRAYVRFYLAFQMVLYGAAKVFKLQFEAPDVESLLTPYGESSPMRLLWTCLGASAGYNVFGGAVEVLAGLLLCTRRTALLGALLTLAVMAQVVALNFCYDIPVKLFSSHLVLMSLFLIAPDLPWLVRVFVLGRGAPPRPLAPLTRGGKLDRMLVVARTALVGAFVAVVCCEDYRASQAYADAAPKPPLYGLWEAEEFALDGEVRPPLTTDPLRWQHVVFTRREYRGPLLAVTTMRGGKAYYPVEVDEGRKTITISGPGGEPPPVRQEARLGERGLVRAWAVTEDPSSERRVLRYTDPEPGVIVVEGPVETVGEGGPAVRHVRARLRHVGEDRFLLLSRGFHWVNETAHNAATPRAGGRRGVAAGDR
jgi:hypothetical protein